jgi:hypothetical protein
MGFPSFWRVAVKHDVRFARGRAGGDMADTRISALGCQANVLNIKMTSNMYRPADWIHVKRSSRIGQQPLIFTDGFYFLFRNELSIEFEIILKFQVERLKRYKPPMTGLGERPAFMLWRLSGIIYK